MLVMKKMLCIFRIITIRLSLELMKKKKPLLTNVFWIMS